MLGALPHDILRRVVLCIANIDDIQSVSKTCKFMNSFVRFQVNDVRLQLVVPYQVSLKFLTHMKALASLSLYRTFDIKLNLDILQGCTKLDSLIINNTQRVVNIPKNIIVTIENMQRLLRIQANNKKHKQDDCQTSPISPKEYFQSRYNTRFGKYGSKKFSYSI